MEILGKIKKILDIQTFNSGFKKRELILLTEEQYPQSIIIEFIQDKIDLLDKLKIEDNVKISINIKGREWVNSEGTVKYFNSIQGWKIEKIKNTTSDLPDSSNNNVSDNDILSLENEFDDLPF